MKSPRVEAPVEAPYVSGPIVLLRVGVAVLVGIHGYYRLLAGGVTGFGGFLDGVGFPGGLAIAWAITIFEMTASILLLLGRYVRVVIPGFLLILSSGIALVHAPNGWFVVGGGRNGVEYSVLLLVSLVVLFLAHKPSGR